MASISGNKYKVDTSKLKVYSGYLKSKDDLCKVASGGAATAMAENIIQNGGVVFGVAYKDDFKSAHFMCAESIQDLEKIKSSKYIVPEKKCLIDGEYMSVYSAVERRLSEGRVVLFIGTGCDVGALLKYTENHECDTKNLYSVDIICHGPTYPEALSQYVTHLEEKYGTNIIKFNMRHKIKGTKPPFIYAEFSNGKKFKERLYESDFGYAFQAYKMSACYNCQFKGDSHKADLTIGDYWGCTRGMKEFNQFGVSVLFTRTEKGEDLIRQLKALDSFVVNSADMEIALANNPAFYKVRTKNQNAYEKFQNDMQEHGLHYAVRHSKGYIGYIKRAIKKRFREITKE